MPPSLSLVLHSLSLSSVAEIEGRKAHSRNKFGETDWYKLPSKLVRVVGQPMSGREEALLPEGQRVEGTHKFWSATKANLADQIEYQQRRFEVVRTEEWAGIYVWFCQPSLVLRDPPDGGPPMDSQAPLTQYMGRAVNRCVSFGTGLPGNVIVPANEPYGSPRTTYASVLLLRVSADGRPWNILRAAGNADDQFILETQVSTTWSYHVTFHGPGAFDCALKLHAWLSSQAGLTRLSQWSAQELEAPWPLQLTLLNPGTPEQIDDVFSGVWESKASLDLDFGTLLSQRTWQGLLELPESTIWLEPVDGEPDYILKTTLEVENGGLR